MPTVNEKHEYCSQAREMLKGMLKIYQVAQYAKYRECEKARWTWSAAMVSGQDGIAEFKAYLVAQRELFEMTQQISSSHATTCEALLIAVDAWASAPKGEEVAT